MIAENNEFMQEATETLYALNADELIRQQCLAREDYYRTQNTYDKVINDQAQMILNQELEIESLNGEKAALTAEINGLTAENDSLTVENDSLTAEINDLTAENDSLTAEIQKLLAHIAQLETNSNQRCNHPAQFVLLAFSVSTFNSMTVHTFGIFRRNF